MAEVGVSVAAKLAEYLVDPTLRQLQYLFCARKITKDVEMRKEELTVMKGRVQERVQEAINKTERIDDEVDKWTKDVETLIALVDRLEEELRANNSCLRGWCPTWRRYCLCKKLAKATQTMIDLNTVSDHFNPFSHPVIIPDIEYHSSENFKLFKSTKMAFNQLCEALQDNSSSIIALWGMGGSGKTTLVKEVGKKAKESLNFDRVVLTTISETPSITKIQDEIADTLGITLGEKSETGRAKRISLRLESGERILIILDDMWAKLNLEDIGIPFRESHQTSFKVVMTTRRVDVCSLMESQKIIQLDLLEEEEAWTLFQTHTNVGEAAEDVARAIAKECKGLPIAIVAVGSCLKGKGIDEMKEILHRLRNAKPINVDKGVRDAFTCLELSYDYLATQEAKLLLLLCAMFPEDYSIDVEDLFRYGVGLGLCRDIESFEVARSKVRTTINHLIDSSLLMHSPNLNKNRKEYVTMHDVVRDFALWKASKEDHAIVVNCTEGLNKLIADDVVKDCYAIASWYANNELLQLPFQLDAPKLEFLLLHSRKTLDISHASFEVTKQLKALIIIFQYWYYGDTFEILQLQPIRHLSNLRTLRLQRWDLRDISFVVSLTRLEVLDLQGSNFERVPNGIENLSKLKLLDLSKCRIEECCYKVIGMCSQLEELYVPHHFRHSKNESCYEYLGSPTILRNLRMYNLEIGAYDGFSEFLNDPRCLHLGQLNISVLGAIIKDLAQRATTIQFYKLEGNSKSFMNNIVQAVGGMVELAKLNLDRCSEIECIVDESTLHNYAIVPRLDELVLRNMDNLHQICRGHSPFSLFQKLERLGIYNCPQLLHIFPAGCNLGNLNFLEIFGCPMLTFLFPISATCTLLSLKELRIKGCSNLKHVLEGEGGGDALENLRFPKLKILSVGNCHKLEYVCSIFYAQRFHKLQNLCITNAPEMKFLFRGGVGEEQAMHDHYKSQLVLPLLEYLKLESLPNLVGICSERYQTIWPSIKTLEWQDCPNLELQELKSHQWRNDEYKPLAVIERIQLDNCNAEFIFHYQIGVGEQYPKFQYLRELTLRECARLKFVFSTHICQSLPELTSLSISSCDELEAIFSENEVDQKNLSITESCLVKLKSLIISKCNKLKFILSFIVSAATPMLPQLSTLNISDCSQMEEIFKCSNTNDHGIHNEGEITFRNMKNMELENLPRLVNFCQGFTFQTGEFCTIEVHDCPKFMPIMSATIDWTKEELIRSYKLKHSQLNNTEALNLPLSVMIPGEIDIQSPSVEHYWEVIGDDETNDLGMLGGHVAFQVMSFQYLHSLEVTQCKKLKFLFSMSTIVQNSLPKLDTLILSDCEELEVIFGHSGGEDNANYSETIVLSSLRRIELNNLPNFKSVCQVGLEIQLQLKDIGIQNCPKFVDSNLGGALQQLGSILVSKEDSNIETSSNVNEDTGMKSLISRAKWLYLEDSMNLLYVWEGPTFITFQNLKELYVIRCRRLKCIFSSTVMRSLPCFSYLWIEECEEMEEIMSSELEEEHELFPNEFSNSSLCFPRLKYLIVERCKKLKWLFPSLHSTQHLPRLTDLMIMECCQLKGLFNSEVEIQEEGFYFNSLPNLIDLEVVDCPSFSEATLSNLERLEQWNRRI